MMRTSILGSLFLSALAAVLVQAGSTDKEALLSKYRDKFVVVVQDGLSTMLCSEFAAEHGGYLFINERGEIKLQPLHFGDCGSEPMHMGEVLKVSHVSFQMGYLFLGLKNVSPHSVMRGIGAFAHQSLEVGGVTIRIRAGSDGKNFGQADSFASRWLKPFDSAAEAARFGNTATGVFVNQVKAGMSFAEVERVLGLPQTRVDLGDKILYKYKDMTIEFHDGKVADVR